MGGKTINDMGCEENFNYDRVKSVILYLIYKYPHITATRLQKFYYLAELRSIEKIGKRISDVNYCSYHYGPYSPDVAAVADGLENKEIQIKQFESKEHHGRAYEPNMESVTVNLEKDDIQILNEIIHDYKYKKNETILKEVYESEPYVWAKFAEDLDFEEYLRECDMLYRNPKIIEKIENNKREKGTTYNTVDDLVQEIMN